MSPSSSRGGSVPSRSRSWIIPFDYAARLELTGQPGNIVQDVINISADGVFVAVAIGYGFEAVRTEPIEIFTGDDSSTGTVVPAEITLGELPPQALIDGIQINSRAQNLVFDIAPDGQQSTVRREFKFSDRLVPDGLANTAFQRVSPPGDISFLFNLIDSGSGRELQDLPSHNIASLGTSTGERPFRPLAQPMSFLPRSTVRVQVIERTEGAVGTLFIVLYGFSVLTGSACPQNVVQATAAAAEFLPAPSAGASRTIPFDYVGKFALTGRPGNQVEDEITINVEGGFVATALGYGLAVEEEKAALLWDRALSWTFQDLTYQNTIIRPIVNKSAAKPSDNTIVDLNEIPLLLFPTSALIDGIRIRPNYLRLALQAGGTLATVSRDLADEMFERLNKPEDVSFRYTISDTGTGRNWQNQPIYNVAGLGIANGLRPFKKFARPIMFQPRSSVRINIEEGFGRGTLFLAFHGYKLLQGAGGRT